MGACHSQIQKNWMASGGGSKESDFENEGGQNVAKNEHGCHQEEEIADFGISIEIGAIDAENGVEDDWGEEDRPLDYTDPRKQRRHSFLCPNWIDSHPLQKQTSDRCSSNLTPLLKTPLPNQPTPTSLRRANLTRHDVTFRCLMILFRGKRAKERTLVSAESRIEG